ncbi:MAG: hypothetical protein QMD53_00075 [Actinomycetota bacterium]|nr:hypothetical protein [Actinomycetota bacterium]
MDSRVGTLVSFFAIALAAIFGARYIFMVMMEKGAKKDAQKDEATKE